MARYGLVGSAYTSQSAIADCETLINWYQERMESEGAKSSSTLYPRPGLTTFATLPESPVRGEVEINGRTFAVGGTKFCEVFSDGTVTTHGTVDNDSKPVSLSTSQTQIFIVSAGVSYSFTLATNLFAAVTANIAATPYTIKATAAGASYSLAATAQTIAMGTIASAQINVVSTTEPADLAALTAGSPITVAGNSVASRNGTFDVYGKSAVYNPAITTWSYDITYDTGVVVVGNGSGGTLTLPASNPSIQVSGSLVKIRLNGTMATAPNITVGQTVTIASSDDVAYDRDYEVSAIVQYFISGSPYYRIDCIAPAALAGHAASGGGTLTPQTATPISAVMGQFCDGYFVRIVPGSQEWGVSKLLDCATWDLADVSRISVFPDNAVSLLVDHREVWIFGRTKTVVYYNSGNADFPFDVVSGGYIEMGCIAPFSPVRLDNSIFWLGRDDRGSLMAVRANGYLPVRVSTHAVENEWQGYADATDAESFSYQWNGHTFWEIYFPTANKTWVYDASVGLWHREDGPSGSAHRARCHTYAFGKHLVGDWNSAKIYYFDSSSSTDNGTAITFERQTPILAIERLWIRHDEVIIDCESVGGAAATISLQWSDDGTTTYSTVRTLTATSAGHTRSGRVIYRRLGRARARIYRIRTTSPLRIIDGYLSASPGYRPMERQIKDVAKSA